MTDVPVTVSMESTTVVCPVASATVMAMSCSPRPTTAPAGGSCVITRSPVAVQSSLATTELVKLGTKVVQSEPAGMLFAAS